MSNINYKQVYAIKKKNEQLLLTVNKDLKNESGIYFLTRTDEEGINYFYIGQSVEVKNRMCSHMTGWQHIDLSLRKRGFYNETDNPYGWKINVIYYPKSKLDEMEQYWILEYMKNGYQCRYNKTAGGQGKGKEKINEYRPQKGYRDGIQQGKINLARELKDIIDKHLVVSIKEEKKNNKISIKALDKFNGLIDENTYKED